jgi:xanthine dehydrogenase accessory factor
VNKELELWQFIASRINDGENVMLLVVAESSGSSPGRQGYKMAVGADGELYGSIGGGVMEVNLVENSREILSELIHPNSALRIPHSALKDQVHRQNSPNASGMICSGEQTVIFKLMSPEDSPAVESVIDALSNHRRDVLTITAGDFIVRPAEGEAQNLRSDDAPTIEFHRPRPGNNPKSKIRNPKFQYTERLGFKNDLYIIGGGHCALALSELMSRMDFHISLFDDRPELNTIDKNRFAHRIQIVDNYDDIAIHVPAGASSYVVVMTLGYASDELVIRALIDKEFKYFGVLGSNAKMSIMLRKLLKEGLPADKLGRIRTPIGLPIQSRTPEEIAVSIAAEIISIKNA